MSSILNAIRPLQDIVKEHLETNTELRDNDDKLVANVWFNQIKKEHHLDPATISGFVFMRLYSEGKLFTADAITRVRRKIQEQNPELRGANWAQRHKDGTQAKYMFSS